jgi:putative DNA primase/helicase
VQPDIVRAFFDNSKGLARGSGFAARFLIAYPETTQGTRMFKAAPPSWPGLSAFHRRITELLNQLPAIDERGTLQLSQLSLSQAASASWVHFHNEVEYELRPFGDMADVRDVASKAADNAARLAALFHVYEHGAGGEITAVHVQAAAQIVSWHLYEARRFLSEVAAPRQADNAMRLDRWLIARCREWGVSSISTRDVQRCGPPALRDSQARDEAVAELIERSRIRLIKHGHPKNIEINPALLGSDYGAA